LERSQTKSKQAILGTFPDKEQAGHSWNVPRQRASRPFLERSQTKSKQAILGTFPDKEQAGSHARSRS
jgi:hypothetical protein